MLLRRGSLRPLDPNCQDVTCGQGYAMTLIPRLLLIPVLSFLGLAAAHGTADPVWLFPADGDTFCTSTPPLQNSDGYNGVVVRVEVPKKTTKVSFYVGNTLVGETMARSYLSPPTTRIFVGRLHFATVGPRTLTAQADDGFNVTTLQGPAINIVSPAPAPTFELLAPTDITSSRATLHSKVDVHGAGISQLQVEYGPTTAYGSQAAVYVPTGYYSPILEANVEIKKLIPETAYHYRFKVNGSLYSDDGTFTTTENLPPATKPDIGVLHKDGTCQIYISANDSDDSLDPLLLEWPTIVSVTQGAHGTVEISHSGTPRVRYTADSTFTDIDTFTYTVEDPYGVQSEGTVTIRSVAEHFRATAGSYFADLGDVGTLSVRATRTGTFSGTLTIYGIPHGFSGAFLNNDGGNEASESPVVHYNVSGIQPTTFVFYIYYDLDYSPQLVGGSAGGVFFDIPPSPQLLPSGEDVPEAGTYAQALPNPLLETDSDPAYVPQGNGFSVMKVAKSGRVTTTGRTPDNQPFSTGIRLRRDHSLGIRASVGVGRRGHLSGVVGFDATAGTGGDGELTWSNPERKRGPYNNGFTMTIKATGERFEPPVRGVPLFTFDPGTSPSLDVTALSHDGTTEFHDTLPLNGNRADNGIGAARRLRLTLNPRTGLFSGTIAPTSGRRLLPIRGVILPKKRLGVGIIGTTGQESSIQFTAP
jgi:hypothetical protein